MTKMALNIELDNGRVIGQTVVPVECEDVQGYLEEMYKHKVITFDITVRGSMVKIEDMNEVDRKTFEKDVKKALELADDFGYSEDVKRAIKACKSQIQLDNVLAGARHNY
jgi:hypothetical protein